MSLAKRKQYARRCIIEGRTNTRGFDNCFEEGDADQVVTYLVETALSVTERPELPQGSYSFNDPVWKNHTKVMNKYKFRQALEQDNPSMWNSWLYWYQNGSYEGYDRTIKIDPLTVSKHTPQPNLF